MVDVAVAPKGSPEHKAPGFGQGLCVPGAKANSKVLAGSFQLGGKKESAASAAPAPPSVDDV